MNYIISNVQLYNVVFKWLDNTFSDAEEKPHPNLPNTTIFLIKNRVIAQLENLTNMFYFSNQDIWDIIQELFRLTPKMSYEIINQWLKLKSKSNNYIPQWADDYTIQLTFKLNSTS